MSARIQFIIEFMKANLHRRLMLDEIAQAAEISRSHLCFLFKTEFDMPPGQYLKMLRMQKARELLQSTSLNVKAIIARVGIQDKSHFTRDFKKTYGVTPSRHRKRLANEKLSENDVSETK